MSIKVLQKLLFFKLYKFRSLSQTIKSSVKYLFGTLKKTSILLKVNLSSGRDAHNNRPELIYRKGQ